MAKLLWAERHLFMIIKNIADGVRLVNIKTDKFKTSRITFTMASPLCGNISAKALLPYLLSRRCAKYPDFTEFKGVLDSLYGAAVSAGVSKQGEAMMLTVSMTAIDDRFALDGDKITKECVDLLTDLIFDPVTDGESFPADIIEEEKRLLTEKLLAQQNDKRRYALDRCEAIMFANEAYGNNCLGTVENIASLTAKDVYAQWLDIIKTAQMQITVVSSCDAEMVTDILTEKLSGKERNPALIETEFVTGAPKPNYVSETQPVKQGKLVMGFRTGMRNADDNADAMRVAVDIFGGGTYSKLFSVVREKMSLCYYCSAMLVRHKGVVMIQSGIENENEEKARKEILNQLGEVAAGNFTNDDFTASVKSLCDSYISYNDTPEELCEWYAAQILKEDPCAPEDMAQRIRSVDRADVVRSAKTIMLDTVFMLKGNGEGDSNEN